MEKSNLILIVLGLVLLWAYISTKDSFYLSLLAILGISSVFINEIEKLEEQVRNIKSKRTKSKGGRK